MSDPATSGDLRVRDNADAERYEIEVGGELAFLEYRRTKHVVTLIHTEVPESLRGHGLAPRLAKWALDAARAEGHRVVVICPFIKTYLRRHPEYESLITREA